MDQYDDFAKSGGNAFDEKVLTPFKNSVVAHTAIWFTVYAILIIVCLMCIVKWYRGESFMPTVTAADTERDDTGAKLNQMNIQGPPMIARQGSLFVANSQEDTSDGPLVLLPTSGSAVLASPDFNCQFDPSGGLLNPITDDSRKWIGSALGIKETMSVNRMEQALHGN